MLLTHRKLLQSKAISIGSRLRGTFIQILVYKVGVVGEVGFRDRIRNRQETFHWSLIVGQPYRPTGCCASSLASSIAACSPSCGTMPVCRRLMTTPGVGPGGGAVTYRATVDVPATLQEVQVDQGSPSELTSQSIRQSGPSGRYHAAGDEMMRVMPYEAAGHVSFKEMVLAQGLGHEDRQAPRDEKGNRGLARGWPSSCPTWVDGAEFQWTREAAVA